ncbi:MAG: Rrf2 family transcriptional regulator [Candidatus Aminicenantes bacterium]|nr:Rrf2 family transcriptional regulator [Candidatus Aminicenantes bacterium]MDH5743035.1 Rrf2 family transcriptional regulator [Candidatus Aminicenantes bacterium]
MIKLSTKGRYGTRLMLNLALHYEEGKEAVVLKNISEEEDLSIRYLEQIIIPLKLNKLVKSVRGAGGGYTLARDPSKINLCQIIEVLEGSCTLVDCVDDPDFCDRATECATHEIWKEASMLLKNYFESKTLQDLLEIAKKKKIKGKRK